jgi:hypothetical protein
MKKMTYQPLSSHEKFLLGQTGRIAYNTLNKISSSVFNQLFSIYMQVTGEENRDVIILGANDVWM